MPTAHAVAVLEAISGVLDRPEGAISESAYARVASGEAKFAKPQWPQIAALRAKTAAQIEALNAVPVEPFRDRLLYLLRTGQGSVSGVCHRLGEDWCPNGKPETTRLQRLLGMEAQAGAFKTRKGDTRPTFYPGGFSTAVPYDLGVRLADALEMDPVDAGV